MRILIESKYVGKYKEKDIYYGLNFDRIQLLLCTQDFKKFRKRVIVV
jgi:hypothetical protein